MKTRETPLGIPNAEQQHAANYASVVYALLACEESCNACADSLLEKINQLDEFRRCIRLTLDCADISGAMLRLLMRQTSSPNLLIRAQLQACAIAGQLCAEECRAHAATESQCQVCGEVCQHCAERCQQLIEELNWEAGSAPPFAPVCPS